MTEREYWDLDLKNQSKKRLAIAHATLKQFGGIIHDQHESKYFTGKLSWRNPLVMRISLPKGQRYKFIRASHLWLSYPERLCVPEFPRSKPLQLWGEHNQLKLKQRRSYCFAWGGWVKDFHPGCNDPDGYAFYPGTEVLRRVLDGDLDCLKVKELRN